MDTGTNDQVDSQQSTSSDHDDNNTLCNEEFLISVRKRSITEVESAISNKLVKIDYQNVIGDTALHLAIRKRKADIAELLINRGADVNIRNKYKKRPLQMVQERLEKDPTNVSLRSIEDILMAGPSFPTGACQIADNSSQFTESQTNESQTIESQTNESQMTQTSPRKPKPDQAEVRRGLRSNFHGPIYQTKLLALFVKRALKIYKFKIESEMHDAEALDDIVLCFEQKDDSETQNDSAFDTEEPHQSGWRFVQVKHKQNTKTSKITISELLSCDNKKDFSIQKYFVSFCKIKYNENFGEDALFNDFAIITNTEFDIGDKKTNKGIADGKKNSFYFKEDKEDANLRKDPLLNVPKYKPRKFKLAKNAKSELRELFTLGLLESVLKIKEIDYLRVIRKKLELLKSIKRINPEDMNEAEKKVEEIKSKKKKTAVLKSAKELLALMKRISIQNETQQSSTPKKTRKKKTDNHSSDCKCEICNLSKSIDLLESLSVEKKHLEKINKHIQDIHSQANAWWQRASQNKEDLDKSFGQYKDSSSKEKEELEIEEKKLFDDENALKKMRDDISKSDDIEWIKHEITTSQVCNQNHRIAQGDIKSIQKENDLENVKRFLDERFQSILFDISIIKIALYDGTFDQCLNEFLEKFCIITNYPNELQLSDIIKKEVGETFSLLNADLLRDSFEREMINFLKEKLGRTYDENEGKEFFKKMEQQINIFMSVRICMAYTEQLDAYGIHFHNRFKEITKLTEFISDKNQKVLHIIDKYTRLSAIKVFRNLADSGKFANRDSYIFIRLSTILHRENSREFVLNAFKSGIQSNTVDALQHSTQSDIVNCPIASQNTESVDLCVIECREKCMKNIEFESNEQNLEKLFKALLDILSGSPMKQIVIIAPEDNKLCEKFRVHYDHISNPSNSQDSGVENLQLFDTKEEIKFKHLDGNSQDRVLAKNVKFQEKDNISFNQLIDKKLACQIIDTENLLRLIENELIQIGDEKAFHSIGYVRDLYIARKFIAMDGTTPITEANLVEKCEKLTLLSNDAGMGKSTVLTSLANEIRKLKENAWIVRIDLNDHAATPHSLCSKAQRVFK